MNRTERIPSKLDGITFTSADGRIIPLTELVRRYEFEPQPQVRVDDGTRHSLYNRPHTRYKCQTRNKKQPPVYTKEYNSEDIFNYILRNTPPDFRNNYESFTELMKGRIKKALECYGKYICKECDFTATESDLHLLQLDDTLLLLCESEILKRKITSTEPAVYKFTKNTSIKTEQQALQHLISGATKFFQKEENEIPVCHKSASSGIEKFNQNWMAFHALFPYLNFETYLRMIHCDTHTNTQKE
jgi:hypothetical protein